MSKDNQKDREKTSSPKEEDVQKDLENILDQLSEQSSANTSTATTSEQQEEEIIKKPKGVDEEAESIEGLLEKITEKKDTSPPAKKGFFQKLLDFFRK
ncbi:MAG: hypothetical protein D6748_07065 [Calditrichaeota bacterium]|nr:MAG: hypothetical protein D6748_07065 [Calditrichota bacterium]